MPNAPTTISVAILGLGRAGASLGLALKANARKDARQNFAIVGYDTDEAKAGEAKAMDAVDSLTRRAADAVAGKDIVFMCLPPGEVQGGYAAIVPNLRPGAVVLDTTVQTSRAAEWWRAASPGRDVHRVGVHPTLNPAYLFDGVDLTSHAHADLFAGALWLVLADAYATPDAVQLAGDMALLVGATVHYADPLEHDGWIASLEALPAALGLAAFMAVTEREGWPDAQRAADANFARLTHVVADTHPDDLRALLLPDRANRANLVRALDAAIAHMNDLRDRIAADDGDALRAVAERASMIYAEWLRARQSGAWDKRAQTPDFSPGQTAMTALLGGALAKRLRDDGKT